MIVTIGGPPGSGKTTTAELYAKTRGCVLVSGGRIFREMAAERNLDVTAFGAYAEEHHEVDRQLDAKVLGAVRSAGREGRDVTVDGRIQAYLLAREGLRAFAVLITAPIDVRIRRVAQREGTAPERAKEDVLKREASERVRYADVYGINLDDTTLFDLAIDSSEVSPEAIVERIRKGVEAWAGP